MNETLNGIQSKIEIKDANECKTEGQKHGNSYYKSSTILNEQTIELYEFSPGEEFEIKRRDIHFFIVISQITCLFFLPTGVLGLYSAYKMRHYYS
ncbi:unnamed protein product, partial [Brachionus calyciflorus]